MAVLVHFTTRINHKTPKLLRYAACTYQESLLHSYPNNE